MSLKNFPNSIRLYIRREKARIRREVLDFKEQKSLIGDLYQKLLKTEGKKTDKVK